jgi:hypothetical protein
VDDLWRPVTAIREGDRDGNDATTGDPAWDSLQSRPPGSESPSTQSTFSGAAATVLAAVLGSDPIGFSATSGQPFEGIARSFTRFSQAARGSADSRDPLRSACEDGLSLGQRIGRRAVALSLQPART